MKKITIIILISIYSIQVKAQTPTWLTNWYNYISSAIINGPPNGGTKLIVGNIMDTLAKYVDVYGTGTTYTQGRYIKVSSGFISLDTGILFDYTFSSPSNLKLPTSLTLQTQLNLMNLQKVCSLGNSTTSSILFKGNFGLNPTVSSIGINSIFVQDTNGLNKILLSCGFTGTTSPKIIWQNNGFQHSIQSLITSGTIIDSLDTVSGIIHPFYHGTGTPEGSISSNIGKFYVNNSGGLKSTFWVKESGSGNTGWKRVLTDSVNGNDISFLNPIPYNKTNLSLSIKNADISTSAGIQYSKLNLFASIQPSVDFNTGGTPSVGTILSSSGWISFAKLNPVSVKTTNYTAVANDLVPCDNTSGSFTVTLPNAPTDMSVLAIKLVVLSGTNVINFVCSGIDVFNKTGGATSGTLSVQSQSVYMQYKLSSHIWYIISTDVPLSSMDLRYAGINSAVGGDLVGNLPNPTIKSSVSLTTPILNVATATTINKVTITAPATGSTLTISDGKTATFNNSILFSGTDATIMTFPTTNATVARTDALQTFSGVQTFTNGFSASSSTFTGSPTLASSVNLISSNTSIIGGTLTTTQTVNYSTGATASGQTKTIHVGDAGVSGSTTNITIGSSSGTSTTSMNGVSSINQIARLFLSTGTNTGMVTATLASGTVTVSNTSVTANTKFDIDYNPGGQSIGVGNVSTRFYVSTITAGTSFVVVAETLAGVANTTDNSVLTIKMTN